MAQRSLASRLSRFFEELTGDGGFLFTTRIVRMFAYGFLSVILVLYLAEVGLAETEIGVLLTLTLLGDTAISLWITTHADRIGRRRMLILGSILMVFAGILFAFTGNFILLLIAATIGVISPSGNEVGPFLSIEQASLSQIVPDERRTGIFAWYNLVGSFATALGALAGGFLVQALQDSGVAALVSYRAIIIGYAILAGRSRVVHAPLSGIELSGAADSPGRSSPYQSWLGLHRSRRIILKLSALFSLDAFAGGFVLQSIVAYWFTSVFRWSRASWAAFFSGRTS